MLLLGHGFMPGTQAALKERLRTRLSDKLLHSYEREGLFLFADREAKTTAQKEAIRFQWELQPEGSTLKKLTACTIFSCWKNSSCSSAKGQKAFQGRKGVKVGYLGEAPWPLLRRRIREA